MILTIGHTKGGVGKSTLAWHLAHSFHDKKVAIIDLDFQQTLHYINLMGDSRLNLIQPKNSDELIDFLTMTASQYDFVLIDVGGFDSDINRTALSYSDKILIPVSDSITEVLGFMTFKEILKEISTSADFYIVLNNIHPLTKNFDTIKEAIADTNIVLLSQVIRSRKIYKTTMGQGKSVFDGDDEKYITGQLEILGMKNELISPA
jgi:chromosome partitioning protein